MSKRYIIRDTGTTAINSGRPRWSVWCNTCKRRIHSGTTDACAQIEMHEEQQHGRSYLHTPSNRVLTPTRGVK